VGALLGCLLVGGGLALFWDQVCQFLSPGDDRGDKGGKAAGRRAGGVQPKQVPAHLQPLQWQFQHDEAGRVTRVVDPAGRVTRNRYELDAGKRVRRVVKERADHSRVVLEFDRFGRRTRLADALGKVDYEYDGFNRLTAVRRAGAPAVTYQYDTEDRVVALSVGKGWTLGYAYDFLGRLARITTPRGDVTYEYLPGSGQVQRTLPNGIRTLWQYQPDGELQTLTHVSADRKILAEFTYAYRPDGLLRQVKEWSPQGEKAVTYAYDTVQRLTAVNDSRLGKTVFRYDPYGNRIEVVEPGARTVASVHDWAGRLVRHNSRECAHDAVGNLVKWVGKQGKSSLAYTPDSLLASARTERGMVQYRYDGEGNLVGRQVDKARTSYVPDPRAEVWRPLLTTEGTGQQTFYVWESDTSLAAVADGKVTFFLHDHLGGVRWVADQKGQVTGRLSYRAFGSPEQELKEVALRPAFTGLFYDPVAGLYLTRARAYDPELGRFLGRDPEMPFPVCAPKDLSAYAYCGNDPINWEDRTGRQPNIPPSIQQRQFDKWLSTLGRRKRRNVPSMKAVPVLTFDGRNLTIPSLKVRATAVSGSRWQYRPAPAGWYGVSQYRDRTGNARMTRDRIAFSVNLTPLFATDRTLLRIHPASDRTSNLKRNPVTQGCVGITANVAQMQAAFKQLLPTSRSVALLHITDSGQGKTRGAIPRTSPLLPSKNVGGVSLRGAGAALKDLGPLKGIAVDANGRLVLIAQEKGDIHLPPLRLDDVVTVFRSVYEHGEAPSVSIDPDPNKPHGPLMHVRHGPGTANTYVGWVLFEADRVMKTYNLGKDNVTGRAFRSDIDGYQKHLDQRFAGARVKPAQRPWERFWIVPAAVNRLQSKDRRLTLLDVPLKLKTEAMVMRRGKLVSAPGGKSTRQALYFTRWFTGHYDELTREARSQPPEGSELTSEVAIFAELQRICLIAAVAERLRDQGVPLPSWMRDYPVKQFPVPATTPATVVKSPRKKGRWVRTIYGGVTLAPAQQAIRTVEAAPAAEALAPVLLRKIGPAPSLTPVAVAEGGQRYLAVAMPGNDSQAVGPCRLEDTDLTITVRDDAQIGLVRHFSSFYQPPDVLGQGWTFDLPRLLKQQRHLRVRGGKVLVQPVYQLTSPLDTHLETFAEQKEVPEVKRPLFVPGKSGALLGVLETVEGNMYLFFRDGRQWDFNPAGHLSAVHEPGWKVSYRRDAEQRLTRIEGESGKSKAWIALAYDDQKRLQTARGSNGVTINYHYDNAGRLLRVEGPRGVLVAYRYESERVAAVAREGQPERRFEYDADGRLRRQWQGKEPVTYEVKTGPAGVVISATRTGKTTERETAEYDLSYRPVRRTLENGTRVEWRYPASGETEITTTLPGGDRYVVKRSADRRRESWRLPAGGEVAARYDQAGRLTALVQDGRPLLRRHWHPSGHLAEVASETAVLQPRYSAEGVPTGLLLFPPTRDGKVKSWLEVQCDAQGRAAEITDSSGARIKVVHDATGQPAAWSSKQGKIEVRRGRQGRVEHVETSWGYREGNQFDERTGQLRRTEVRQGEARALLEYDQGRPARLTQFDGGKFRIGYQDPKRGGQVGEVRAPNGLVLKYRYGAGHRLAAVDCGAFRIEYRYDRQGRLVALAQLPTPPRTR
jgi:RHS repeat-associated protein